MPNKRNNAYLNDTTTSTTTTTTTTTVIEDETTMSSKRPKTNMVVLNEGDLITFNGTEDVPWMLGVALGAKNKVLIIYESNLCMLSMLTLLNTYMTRRDEIRLEDHIAMSSNYKILNLCNNANNFEILNLNLFYPPNGLNSLEFLDILKFNLKIIETLKVGDILRYGSDNGIFYDTGLYIDHSRCRIAYCKNEQQHHRNYQKNLSNIQNITNNYSNTVKSSNLIELASYNRIQILNKNFEDTFHFKPMREKEILNRVESAFENFGEYNCIFNNCEHFVTDCRYGQRKSLQILNVLNMIYLVFTTVKRQFQNQTK